MEMHGEYRIPAPRETVWAALNDPEVLKACIPGCESLETNEEGGFDATVKAKVGPVKATFKGSVRLENVNAPESYTIAGEGKGGAAGFAKGGADVKLEQDGDETVLTYAVNAQVGGKLAQIGGRLIDSTAKKYANDFFGKFVEVVSERAGGAAETSESTPSAEAPPPEEPTPEAPTPETPTPLEAAPDPAPAPSEPPTPAAHEDDVKQEAKMAALEAMDETRAQRKGMSPMRWILVLAIILLGLSLLFGGGGGETGVN